MLLKENQHNRDRQRNQTHPLSLIHTYNDILKMCHTKLVVAICGKHSPARTKTKLL